MDHAERGASERIRALVVIQTGPLLPPVHPEQRRKAPKSKGPAGASTSLCYAQCEQSIPIARSTRSGLSCSATFAFQTVAESFTARIGIDRRPLLPFFANPGDSLAPSLPPWLLPVVRCRR